MQPMFRRLQWISGLKHDVKVAVLRKKNDCSVLQILECRHTRRHFSDMFSSVVFLHRSAWPPWVWESPELSCLLENVTSVSTDIAVSRK